MRDFVKLSIGDILKIQCENNGFRYIDEKQKNKYTGETLKDISNCLFYDDNTLNLLKEYYTCLKKEITFAHNDIYLSINNEQIIIDKINSNKKTSFIFKNKNDQDFQEELDILSKEDLRKKVLIFIYKSLNFNCEKINELIKNSKFLYSRFLKNEITLEQFILKKDEYIETVITIINKTYEQVDKTLENQNYTQIRNKYQKGKKIIQIIQNPLNEERIK